MAEYYVVDGAVLMCNKSDKTSKLKVSGGRKTFIENKPQANIQDYLAHANVKPFGGCALRKKKPCKNYIIITSTWKNGKKDVVIESDVALLRSSKLKCGVGGTISVVMTGQSIEFDRAIEVPIPAPVIPVVPPKEITNDDVLVKVNVPAKSGVVLLINAKIINEFNSFIADIKDYKFILGDCFRDIRKQSHFYHIKYDKPHTQANIKDTKSHGLAKDVASPWNSYHNAGLAFDLYTIPNANHDAVVKIASKHGFIRIDYPNELYHFSYIGNVGNNRNAVAVSLGYKDWVTMVRIAQKAYKDLGFPRYTCPYGYNYGME
jgi:hypothetical protein